MSWTCPTCGRIFKAPSQWHSCHSRDIEEHIETKPVFIQDIIYALLDYCEGLGKHDVRSLKTSIILRTKANFLSILPRKTYVGLEFQLPYETEGEQLTKQVRISGKRLYSTARIHSIDEFDDIVKKWIRDSNKLINV